MLSFRRRVAHTRIVPWQSVGTHPVYSLTGKLERESGMSGMSAEYTLIPVTPLIPDYIYRRVRPVSVLPGPRVARTPCTQNRSKKRNHVERATL